MKIPVRLFAAARERIGTDVVELELPERSTISELRRRLGEHFPQLGELLANTRFAVGASYAAEQLELADGQEVALIPPVSGG